MGNTVSQIHPFCSLLRGYKESSNLIDPQNCGLCNAYQILNNGKKEYVRSQSICPQLSSEENMNVWKHELYINPIVTVVEGIRIMTFNYHQSSGGSIAIKINGRVDPSYSCDDILYELLSRTLCSYSCPCEMKHHIPPSADSEKGWIVPSASDDYKIPHKTMALHCPFNGMVFRMEFVTSGINPNSEVKVGFVFDHKTLYTETKKQTNEIIIPPGPYKASNDGVFLTTFKCNVSGHSITHSISEFDKDMTGIPVDIWGVITQYADARHGISIDHETHKCEVYGELCSVCLTVKKCLHSWVTTTVERVITVADQLSCFDASCEDGDEKKKIEYAYHEWEDAEIFKTDNAEQISFEYRRVILRKKDIVGDVKSAVVGIIKTAYKMEPCRCTDCVERFANIVGQENVTRLLAQELDN